VSAGRYSFAIEQGATWHRLFTWYLDEAMTSQPDLATGWTAALQIRDEAGAVVVSLTDGAGITLGSPTSGAIDCLLDAEATALLATTTNPHVYDLLLDDGTTSYRLVQGAVTVSPRVTVPA
jgi:hypothetical protein